MPYQKPPIGSKLNYGHPLAKGLVGCWLFNEGSGDKVFDYSGNSNHGTITNVAAQSAISGWGAAADGVGLALDGSNDYVEFGTRPSLNFYTGNFSIIANVYPAAVASGPYSLAAPYIDPNKGWLFAIYNSKISFYTATAWKQGASTLLVNTPYQLSVTYDHLTNYKLYVNGVQDGLGTSTLPGAGADTFKIGAYNASGAAGRFNGIIESIFAYNRILSIAANAYLNAFPYCMFDNQPDRRIWSAETGLPGPSTFTPRIIMIM